MEKKKLEEMDLMMAMIIAKFEAINLALRQQVVYVNERKFK